VTLQKKFLELYDGKPVSKKNLEEAINIASKHYIQALGIIANEEDDSFYGGVMQGWIGNLGQQGKEMLNDAIRRGDVTAIAELFKQAYVASNAANKRTAILQKIEGHEADEKIVAYKSLAERAGIDDYASVARQPMMALQALTQKYRINDRYVTDAAAANDNYKVEDKDKAA